MSSRKLYIHFEDRGTSVLHNVDDESAIGDICDLFLKAADISSGFKLERRELQAFTAKGRSLNPSHSVKKAIGKEVDIYLRLTSDRQHRVKRVVQIDAKELTPASTNGGGQLCSAHDRVSAASSEQGPAVQDSHRRTQSPLIAPLLQKAAEKETLQHYKAAAFIYKQVLKPSA